MSDIHGNIEALESLPSDYDELWVLGDLVNYGPDPSKVIAFVRANASVIIRGNHDHAIGYGVDPRSSLPFRQMAAAMGEYTDRVLSANDKEFLRNLPVRAERQVDGVHYYLCHATPADPLYGYMAPDDAGWSRECSTIQADVLLVGHTHVQYERRFGAQKVVNPGSVGQAKIGSPLACYATIANADIQLHTHPYPSEATIAKLEALALDAHVQEQLIDVLRTGTVPH